MPHEQGGRQTSICLKVCRRNSPRAVLAATCISQTTSHERVFCIKYIHAGPALIFPSREPDTGFRRTVLHVRSSSLQRRVAPVFKLRWIFVRPPVRKPNVSRRVLREELVLSSHPDFAPLSQQQTRSDPRKSMGGRGSRGHGAVDFLDKRKGTTFVGPEPIVRPGSATRSESGSPSITGGATSDRKIMTSPNDRRVVHGCYRGRPRTTPQRGGILFGRRETNSPRLGEKQTVSQFRGKHEGS